MYDKDLFDKSPFDRQTVPDFEIAASIDGGVTIYSAVYMRAATGAVVSGSWSVSGKVGLRIPLCADIQVSGSVEAVNLFAHTRLFPNDVTMLSSVIAAVGTRTPLSAEMTTNADFTAEFLKARVKLPDTGVFLVGSIISERAGLRVPLPGSEVIISTDFTGSAGVRVPMHTRDIQITGEIKCAPIFEPGAAKLELQNLNLKPGDELIIDTDVLEVLFNGIPDQDFVSSDSEFFQLYPGNNKIIFMDGETGRKLSVSIVWANRWL